MVSFTETGAVWVEEFLAAENADGGSSFRVAEEEEVSAV
jgi:hypothetical protein